MHKSKQQPASESESMGERRLPRGQNEYLLPRVRELPRVRRSLGAKVATRGTLNGPGLLPERARIAEVARDAEASESCKRLRIVRGAGKETQNIVTWRKAVYYCVDHWERRE